MKVVIDLDLHEAIADFSVKQPASAFELKTQDTPSLEVYFVEEGNNQDLGTGATLKFGLIPSAGGTMLVLYSSFTRQVDAAGLIFYLGLPVFNTAEMLGAIGSNLSIACAAEVRYQVPAGELVHSLDIPFTVFRTILSEVTADATTASFVQPAVNANVSVAIGSTTWLALNQQITITGGGIYKVVSITDASHFVAQNLGAAGAAAPGATVPSGASVINTPITNLISYPPASTLELISTRDVASGHAGLTAATLLKPSVIPIDGQTIQLNGNGQLSSSAILAITAANFTTPASGGTVIVTFVSTSALKAGQYVRIPIAGFYVVNSITNATTAVLQNNGDPFNALAGVTITSGAVVLPAQAAAAGGGGGAPGQNAYTTLSTGFTVPNVGATVSINVAATAWMGGPGYALFIAGAGYYLISSLTDATHLVVTNSGSAANQPPGTNVTSGGTVVGAGPQGAAGAAGASLAAYDALTASFIMPAMNAAVTITISNTAWLSSQQIIYVTGAGYFQVATVANATTLSATNLPYPGNASAGATIPAGSKVSPGGLIGPQGAGGPGLNAFTTLSANFTQPAAGSTVTVAVGTTAWMGIGQTIFITGGGYYNVSSIGDLAHATVTNLGGTNTAPGLTVIGSGTQTVTPAGANGINGINAYTATSTSFITPAAGASVTVTVGSTAWAASGQVLFIAGAGYYQVAAILSPTQLSMTNLAGYGNVAGGTNVGSGATVSASGLIGPIGPPGTQGPPGRDGAYATVYAIDSIQGNGGASAQLQLIGDLSQGTNPNTVYRRDGSGNNLWGAALLSAADAVSAPGTGEVSQIQATTSGVLSLKKLKSGAAGSVALIDQGGSTGDILVDVPVDGTTIQVVGGKLTAAGGGGGGGLPDPKTGIFISDDFLYASGISLPHYLYGSSGTGTISFASTYGLDSTHKVVGSAELRTGTAGSPFAELLQGQNMAAAPWGTIPFSLGALTWKTRVFIEGSLPPTGITYIFKAGIGGCVALAAAHAGTPLPGFEQGFAFVYSPDNNSGQWQIYVGTTTPVAVNTTVAVAGDTAYWLECDINAAWNSFTFYINGTLVATVTTGLPIIGGNPFWNIGRGSGATNYQACIDAWSLNYPFSR